jgi:hypothetical protein
LVSNRALAGFRAAFFINGPIGVVISMPVIAWAWLLIRPCSLYR